MVDDEQERRDVRRFARTFQRGDALVEWYGEDEAAVMRAEMLQEFRRLLPEVPDIGGRRNMFSGFLSGAAQGLAMYRVIVQHGGSLEDTGELMHRRFRARTDAGTPGDSTPDREAPHGAPDDEGCPALAAPTLPGRLGIPDRGQPWPGLRFRYGCDRVR